MGISLQCFEGLFTCPSLSTNTVPTYIIYYPYIPKQKDVLISDNPCNKLNLIQLVTWATKLKVV